MILLRLHYLQQKLVFKHKKNRSKNETVLFILKILDYAKTSFTLFAASSKVIAE